MARPTTTGIQATWNFVSCCAKKDGNDGSSVYIFKNASLSVQCCSTLVYVERLDNWAWRAIL